MAKYEIDNSAEFVNPYNFVIAKFDRKPESKSDSTELRSGVLHCTLKTKTPLAILDTAEVEKDKNGHPSYPFLKVAGKACIPGSSIRGVIRSAYETVTKSCFVTFPDTDELLTTRTPVSEPYKPGILKKTKENGWVLYDAVRGKANVSVNINNHQRVIMSGQTYISTGDYVSCEWKENTKKNNKGRTITTYIANNISKSENETDYVMLDRKSVV